MRPVVGVLLALLAAAGCAPAAPPGPPSYPLPPRAVRADETPVAHPPVTSGDTEFTVIGLSTLPSILGSHAEWQPKGKLVRVRLVAANSGRSDAVLDSRRQLLVTADGAAYQPDPQAMLIKRQPGEFELGSSVRLEFDLYYDVPVPARPAALRVTGGATLMQGTDTPPVDIPLSGSAGTR